MDGVCFMDNHRISVFNSDSFQGNQAVLDGTATEVYIYGYPLVLMDVTKRMMLAAGSHLNRFLNERAFPAPQYTTIVRPNVDTLYSMAWLDLSRGPVMLRVPDTHSRYYLMELLDAWTNVFASIGARTTGTREGNYLITGPVWNGKLPEGTIRVGAPVNTVWIIGRTQTNGPADYPEVHAIQNQYVLIPSGGRGEMRDPCQHDGAKRPLNINPADLVAGMDAATFFQTMMTAMFLNPPWIADPEMDKKLAILGLVPGQTLDIHRLSPPVQHALQVAAAYAPGLIQAGAVQKNRRYNIHGWTLLLQNMGFYGADYMRRAMVAMTGIGANLPHDAVYAPAFTDAAGKPLTGDNTYLIHFNPGELPPVHAFWSITLYNEKGYLVENPIHRYAVSPHLHPLVYNSDGSLDIFTGNTPPGKSFELNWLPAPAGSFNLILRMYWPNEPILTGTWTPPEIQACI
jgi:hypothetical protein